MAKRPKHEREALIHDAVFTLRGMALEVPETPGHPNKMPFSGVLTKIDEISDRPPDGGKGKRVILTREAAEEALPGLLGMPVDFTEGLDGHDVKKKIGVITSADIEGNDLKIGGFFYAADFPQEVARIRSMKSLMGFSWELMNIYTDNIESDPMIITGCVFTGAAVLRKDKAAYQTTSLAASSTKGESEMTPEELQKLMASVGEAVKKEMEPVVKRVEAIENGVKPLQAAAHHVTMVEPHAAMLESCAAAMDKAGIGGHPARGHVKACYAMAAHLRAEASAGRLAHEWPGFSGDYSGSGNPTMYAGAVKEAVEKATADLTAKMTKLTDDLAGANTKLADMKAAADKAAAERLSAGAGNGNGGAAQPDKAALRKTISPSVTALLAKASLVMPEGDGKLKKDDVDAALSKAGLNISQRIEVKNSLDRAGLMAA